MSWHTKDGLSPPLPGIPQVGPFSKQELSTSTGNTGNVMTQLRMVFPVTTNRN
jgi:hypothetical protein